jgi:flagellar basal-body rod modification protein FlgD
MAIATGLSSSPLTGSNSTLGSSSPAAGTLGTLGGVDFLKLLTTQMKYQDPMSPMSSTDMASQLAQFSSVQGIQQLNTNVSNMMLLQGLTQGANLIGKTVTYSKGTGSTVPGQGTVNSVQVQNGTIQLIVNGAPVALSQVQSLK